MHPKIIFVETRERNERAWRGCDAVGCHSNAVSFHYLWYGAIYKRQYTDRLTLSKCMCMRASLEHFGIFTFLNCYFCQYFVSTLKIIHGLISFGGQAPPPTSTPVNSSLLSSSVLACCVLHYDYATSG